MPTTDATDGDDTDEAEEKRREGLDEDGRDRAARALETRQDGDIRRSTRHRMRPDFLGAAPGNTPDRNRPVDYIAATDAHSGRPVATSQFPPTKDPDILNPDPYKHHNTNIHRYSSFGQQHRWANK